MGGGHGDGRGDGPAAAVGAFERVLMRRHRLELRALALSLEAVVRALEALGEQQVAGQNPATALAVAAIQARVPAFWGDQVCAACDCLSTCRTDAGCPGAAGVPRGLSRVQGVVRRPSARWRR